jgi:hypothetical protein
MPFILWLRNRLAKYLFCDIDKRVELARILQMEEKLLQEKYQIALENYRKWPHNGTHKIMKDLFGQLQSLGASTLRAAA